MSTNPIAPLVEAIAEAVAERLEGKGIGPRLLSLKNAAEYLAMSEAGLREAVSNRKLSAIRTDRLIRFDRRDLDRWIEESRT